MMQVMTEMLRVLIVDDHSAIRAGVRSVLESAGDMTVVGEAATADAVLPLVERRRPNVITMDINLGNGDSGMDAIREVLAVHPDIGIMIFTAFGERQMLTEGLDSGARGFLVKDASPDEIVRAVRAIAAGGAYVDPSLSAELVRGRGSERLVGLSDREREILGLLAEGVPSADIAKRLFLSTETVRTHVRNAMRKLDADTRTQAVAMAIRERLIT
jgi:DNA-binding NarL/FixJ family response regulator